jgi:hypothetical protein
MFDRSQYPHFINGVLDLLFAQVIELNLLEGVEFAVFLSSDLEDV